MKQLFQQIEELIPTLPGWGDANKAQALAAMVIALQPEVSCEIGVYGGRTFFGMALAHKLIGKGRVIGIDPWSNDAAVEEYEGKNREFWRDNPLNQIHDDFMANAHRLSVSNVIEIWRVKSDDVKPPESIDLISIDGQHSTAAIRDVDRYATRVRSGGLVVLDDLEWSNNGQQPVKIAEQHLIEYGFRKLYPLGTGAVYQRLK